MKKLVISILILFSVVISKSQIYPPPAGNIGSTAIFMDSVIFTNWVSDCKIIRGFQDISNQSLGFSSAGDSTMVIGKAQSNGVVSLGDGGAAICKFQFPIMNGLGFDFAVFENSFDDTFLELAFVEVSSDGINFFRFPSHSLSDTLNQTGSFGATDATKINNLAGKYRGGYGTPFDLQELANKPGLNINAITHVKVIDVVGSLLKAFATYDCFNSKINDPWPTPFPSSGFDLDAIGVIHENKIVGISENDFDDLFAIYPNPVACGETINIHSGFNAASFELFDYTGKVMLKGNLTTPTIDTQSLSQGVYFLKILSTQGSVIKKIVLH
jgi:hypothetical protein